MSVHDCGRVCVLSYAEADDFVLRGIEPDHTNHYHVSAAEAWQEVRTVNAAGSAKDYSPYFHPIARWVGPRHIERLRAFAWRRKRSSVLDDETRRATGITGRLRVSTMQLEERAS